MRRPNERHLTLPVLLHPQHIPRRRALALGDPEDLPWSVLAVFDQLIIFFNPSACADQVLVLCLALESQCATFSLQSADLGFDIAA